MAEGTVVAGRAERRTIAEAGERYVAHLATVKQRKRTTIEDYRGCLRRRLPPPPVRQRLCTRALP
jgi:hypothetical protein